VAPAPAAEGLMTPLMLIVATVSVTRAVWEREPLVPEIVNVPVPVCVPTVVTTVSRLLADPATDAGLKDADAPAGSPARANATFPLKPFNDPIFTAYVVLPLRPTVRDVGVADTVKSGDA